MNSYDADMNHIYPENKNFFLPHTPGNWIKESLKYTPALKLRMSCGGGMGGAQWFECITSPSTLDEFEKVIHGESKLIKVTRYDGTDAMFNLNNIVGITPCEKLYIEFNNGNTHFDTGKTPFVRLIRKNDPIEITFSDTYGPND